MAAFTQDQQNMIAQIVNQVIQAQAQNLRGQPGPPGEPGPQGLPGPPGDGANAGSKWNARDLGFFNPRYDDKTLASGGAPIEHVGSDTYFRDIHLFITHAKQLVITKGGQLVRDNLWLNLKGDALDWWDGELSPQERRLARMSLPGEDELAEWTTLLLARFKEPSNVALESLMKEKYSIRNAADRREPREYANKIIRYAKDAGMVTVQNQLDAIYNGIDIDVRSGNLRRPKDGTTINDLLSDLDEFKHDWWAKATRLLRGNQGQGNRTSALARQDARAPRYDPANNQFGQYGGRQSQFQRQAPSYGGQPRYQNYPYQNPQYSQQPRQGYQGWQPNNPGNQPGYQNNPGQGYQAGQNPYSNARALPPPPPKQLAIMPNPANAAASASNQQQRQPFRPLNNNQRGGGYYNSNRPQAAYQASVSDELDENSSAWTPTEADSHWLDNRYPDDDDQGIEYPASEIYDGFDTQAKDINFLTPGTPDDHSCDKCLASFASRNKLFKHLREQCWPATSVMQAAPEPDTINPATPSARRIIESTVMPDKSKGPGYAFRSYQYAKVPVRLDKKGELVDICVDSGCPVTMGGRQFLLKHLPGLVIQKMASAVPVRGVGGKIVKTDEFATVKLHFHGELAGQPATGVVSIEVHVIDDFAANLLLGNDVLHPQKMVPNVAKQELIIGSCGDIKVAMQVLARADPHIKRTIRTRRAFTVLPGQVAEVPVTYHGTLPDDRDFLFEPQCNYELGHDGGVYAHVVDAGLAMVMVSNTTDQPVTLERRTRLGTVTEYNQAGCYLAMPEEATKAAGGWMNGRSWKKYLAASFATVYAATVVATPTDVTPAIAVGSLSTTPWTGTTPSLSPIPQIDPALEHVLLNGITVYGNDISGIASLVDSYKDVFIDAGTTVDVPEDEWMPVNLKPGAVPKPNKVYPLGAKDRAVIDATFDKLHQQGKLHWSTQPTSFSYPAFVVWRDLPTGQKGRVVIDIRGLNDITEPDSYPLPLQSDIIATVAGYPYISTIDAVGWFHQFNVKRSDRHKFTIVSHRGQEEASVALMGYKGSPPYAQRQTDKLLRPFKDFARAYIDDIVVFSRTLDGHIEHLRTIFQLFREKRVSLSPTKSYLAYPSVTLLGQRVDSLGMSTSAEKIAAITSLRFPYNLRDLEVFLGLTGWLRSSIPRYAQRAQPLQERKTTLARDVTSTGPSRKRQASKVQYDPTYEETAAFRDLQAAFSSPSFLTHYDRHRRLYVDLDASKQWGFAAIIYHVLGDPPDGTPHARTAVQPIMFLSRCLNGAEKNYWPTELEVAGIVWVIRKIRHMVESTEVPPTVVYTDHSAAVPISRQTTLTTSSTDKLNLRLVRASQYLSGFNLSIRHKAGKSNIVPDALSRLQADVSITDKLGVLESLYGHPIALLDADYAADTPSAPVYHVTLVEMADDFKTRLKQAYLDDGHWSKILDMVRPATPTEVTGIDTVDAGPASVEPDDRTRQSPARSPARSTTPARSTPPAGSTPPVEPARRTLDTGLPGPRGVRFRYHDGLLYFAAGDGHEKLCIPEAMDGEVFKQAHDLTHHGGFMRTYDRLIHSVYIRRMVKRLKTYIAHCPECQLNQTKRHPTYGELSPITSPAIPFHTIAMDFIVALPLSRGHNVLLTITCKFIKKILLLPGHDTWGAVEWANAVIVALVSHDWGIPRAIISDRDSKFMSDFWKAVFGKLGVTMLTSTAYHPQTDGQSERTNQTIEIALRFHLTAHPDDEWVDVVPFLQGENNNVAQATTGFAPNELAYGFKVNDTLGVLTADLPPEDYQELRQMKRDNAEAAMAFAGALSKARYDAKHQALQINVGDKVYLRLHQGYTIPGLANPKLSEQRVGPFKVLEKVGDLAFRLQLAPIMRIHPVISIAQLEPAAPGQDPYNRTVDREPPPVEEEDSPLARQAPHYEIERLLDRRDTRNETQYLVKWKNYGAEHNVWYPLRALDDAAELVAEYEARVAGQQEHAADLRVVRTRGRGRPRGRRGG